MPNHVMNEVTLSGKGLKKVWEFVKGKSEEAEDVSDFCFNSIYPVPKELNVSSGSLELRAKEIIGTLPSGLGKRPKKGFQWLKENTDILLDLSPQDIQYIKNYIMYGVTSWYDWRIKYWGTKWDAYSVKKVSDTTIRFQTAWATPREILERLSKQFPDIKISVTYADEDLGSNCGRYVLKGGKIIDRYIPDYDDCAFTFACEVWEYDPDEVSKEWEEAQ